MGVGSKRANIAGEAPRPSGGIPVGRGHPQGGGGTGTRCRRGGGATVRPGEIAFQAFINKASLDFDAFRLFRILPALRESHVSPEND